MTDTAQLYLVTPPVFDPEEMAGQLARVLDTIEIACVRIALASGDEDDWRRAANYLIEPCHNADVALLIADHYRLVEPLGLDGVHLGSPVTSVRTAREALGRDRIVGAFAGATRHAGMTAAEAGADYVSFGPVGDTGGLGAGDRVDIDLFEWWSEMIETPIVAEGGLGVDLAHQLFGVSDFIVPDPAVWQSDDPVTTIRAYLP